MLLRDLNGTTIVGRSPRLLYCTDTYLPQVNGVSVVTALSVAGMRERGWEVAVIAPKYEEAVDEPYANDCIAGIANLRFSTPIRTIGSRRQAIGPSPTPSTGSSRLWCTAPRSS